MHMIRKVVAFSCAVILILQSSPVGAKSEQQDQYIELEHPLVSNDYSDEFKAEDYFTDLQWRNLALQMAAKFAITDEYPELKNFLEQRKQPHRKTESRIVRTDEAKETSHKNDSKNRQKILKVDVAANLGFRHNTEKLDTIPNREISVILDDNSNQKSDSYKIISEPISGRVTKSSTVENRGLGNVLTVRQLYPNWTYQKIEDIPVAAIGVEFSLPMVAESAIKQRKAPVPPISLRPDLSGNWHWLDSRTAIFKPDSGKLANATRYEISVPSGTKALSGASLLKDFHSEIVTCLGNPKLEMPASKFGLQLTFDSQVDRRSITSKVKGRTMYSSIGLVHVDSPTDNKGPRDISFKLLSEQETKLLLGPNYEPNKTFVLVPIERLEEGERIEVSVQEGIQSLDGTAQTRNTMTTALLFKTTNMLIVPDKIKVPYEPGEPLSISFDQPISEKNSTSLVNVSPPISDLKLTYENHRLAIQGKTRPNTKYEVTIKQGFRGKRDVLDSDRKITFQVGSYLPRILPFAHPYLRINSLEKAVFPIETVNVNRIRVRAFDATDMHVWQRFKTKNRRPPKGRILLDKTIEISSQQDKTLITNVDLTPLVQKGNRQYYISVEQLSYSGNTIVQKPQIRNALPPVTSMSFLLQVTDINATCIPFGEELAFYVCNVRTGEPIKNAKISRAAANKYEIPTNARPSWKKTYEEINRAQEVSAFTDKNGIAYLPGAATGIGGAPFLVETTDDKAMVYGERQSGPESLRDIETDQTWITPDDERKRRRPTLVFKSPFSNSKGFLTCKSPKRNCLIPLKLDSKILSMPAPELTDAEPAVFMTIKLYETKVDKEEISSPKRPRRSAATALSLRMDHSGMPKVEIGSSLRLAAGFVDVGLEHVSANSTKEKGSKSNSRQTAGELRKSLFQKGREVDLVFNSPTSLDALLSPSKCPRIGLDWQVSKSHAANSGSHTSGSYSWKPYPPSRSEFAIAADAYSSQTIDPLYDDRRTSMIFGAPTKPRKKPEEKRQIEVSTHTPNFLYKGDEASVPIIINNPTNHRKNFRLSFSKIVSQDELPNLNFEAPPGKTIILLQHYEQLVARDCCSEISVKESIPNDIEKSNDSTGEKGRNTSAKYLTITLNTTDNGTPKSWSFECDTKLKSKNKYEVDFYGTISTKTSEPIAVNLNERDYSKILSISCNVANFAGPLAERLNSELFDTPIRTSQQRAARVAAMAERILIQKRLGISPTKAQLKSVKDDIQKLEKAVSSDFDFMNWLPDCEHLNSHVYSPLVPLLSLDALLMASDAGLAVDRGAIGIQSNSLYGYEPLAVKKNSQAYRQLQSYAIYLKARLAERVSGEEKDYEDKRCSNDLEAWFQDKKIESLDARTIAWLTMAAARTSVSNEIKAQLRKRLSEIVLNPGQIDSPPPPTPLGKASKLTTPVVVKSLRTCKGKGKKRIGFVVPTVKEEEEDKPGIEKSILPPELDQTTDSALVLLALQDSKREGPDLTEAKDRIARDLMSRVKDARGLTSTCLSLCTRAIFRYIEEHRDQTTSGRIQLIAGKQKSSLSFDKGEPVLNKLVIYNRDDQNKEATDQRIILDDGLHCQLEVSRELRPRDNPPESAGYAIERVFKSGKSGEPVWKDEEGIWHCKRGSDVIMQLTVIPREENEFIVTTIPHPAGFSFNEPKPELTYSSAAPWDSGAYLEVYNCLPQKILAKPDQLELYSRKVVQVLYNFEYPYKAEVPGRYHVPAARIEGIYDSKGDAITKYDTIVVEE